MQPVDVGLQPIERRVSEGVSPVGNTASVPSGTLLRVPSATPDGPTPNAPVVAVNTKKWWQSWTVWLTAVGLPLLDWSAEQILPLVNLDGKSHHVVIFALGLYLTWRRITKNSVIRP
jgi:hypothetical protein